MKKRTTEKRKTTRRKKKRTTKKRRTTRRRKKRTTRRRKTTGRRKKKTTRKRKNKEKEKEEDIEEEENNVKEELTTTRKKQPGTNTQQGNIRPACVVPTTGSRTPRLEDTSSRTTTLHLFAAAFPTREPQQQ